MKGHQIAFAVPGKITNLTGGTIYDRRVMQGLQRAGIDVEHIELPGTFPDPPAPDMEQAISLLAQVPADTPLMIDGLAFGALSPDAVARLRAPLVALVHHPLAEEAGLSGVWRDRLRRTERANLVHARHVIVPSPHTARMLVERYGVADTKITIALPGTDRPNAASTAADPPLILAVGIQVPRKGHDILIEALRHIGDLDWQAMIVGAPINADVAALLPRLVASAGLRDRIRLCGQVDRPELARIFAQSTIFALATRYEGYGMVFAEALAHGLPIVTCATGAVPDTVPEGAGLLVPPDDPEAFAGAMRHMLSDHDLRATCAKAAQRAGAALPGWADTAELIAATLEGLNIVPSESHTR